MNKVLPSLVAFLLHTPAYADIAAPMPPVADVVKIIGNDKEGTRIDIYSGKNGIAREIIDIAVMAGMKPDERRRSKGYAISKRFDVQETTFTRNRAAGYSLYILIPRKDAYVYANSERSQELSKSGYTLSLEGEAASTLMGLMKKAKIGDFHPRFRDLYIATYRSVTCEEDTTVGCVLKIKK